MPDTRCVKIESLLKVDWWITCDVTIQDTSGAMFSIDMLDRRYAKIESLLKVDWWIKSDVTIENKLCFQLIHLIRDTRK